MSETTMRAIAHILGASSAAADALADLARRREAGEDAVIYSHGSYFLVGPRLNKQAPQAGTGCLESVKAQVK